MSRATLTRFALGGIFIWLVRLATSLPFLDDEQRLAVTLTDDQRLPERVEVFFSVLILTLVASTLLASIWAFRTTDGNSTQRGLAGGLVMLAVVATIDLVLAVGAGTRTLGGWFVNQLLDLSPLVLIPLAAGFLLDLARDKSPTNEPVGSPGG